MPVTNFMERVEKLQQETGCSRELSLQAVAATGQQVARTEIPTGQRVLCRARSLMRNKGYSWSKAIDVAAETID